ncbi:NAD(P)-dependent oxidoreductase [Neptunomonas phycophila]|uniref:NAD(P)-dependent oxidoreductase n=1 Tax=Neptunomonas TaxID=75687 RepID=UPI0024B390FC|nr:MULTISPECIES: NAD(P)-dependent oxidoreductase [Neptunomonas]MDN2659683.1 NAD(P)-dependent oxidoreductase [Neptunomonas sp. CHC150]MDO6783172.1 NAD(P)-dependent oxidoreductase [Neptunomonas phycophila]
MNNMKVAFIGLGTMGYPMAGHLAAAGHDVTVYNRTQSKAQSWVAEFSGQLALTPKEAAREASIVFVCVGNDDDLREVTSGSDGVLKSLMPGAILVDHTTASAEAAREISEKAAEVNVQFLDAPVSGGQAGAENGVLSVMVGGSDEAFAIARPVMEAYGKSIKLLGPVGSGQLAKMVNQICIAGLLQGLAEGVQFAQKAGLDAHQVFELIQHGAAGSWQMANRHKTMLAGEYDFGFAVDWMRKDLGIALNEASRNGAQLPVTKLVDSYYAEVQTLGGGRMDTSSLLKRFELDQ